MTISALRAPKVAPCEALSPPVQPQLSTDYLNRFGEALMLIEMAPMDGSVLAELQSWAIVGYVEHFRLSQLRGRAAAIAGYEQLSPSRRRSFDALCETMNQLIRDATELLTSLEDPEEMALQASLIGIALRGHISRATQFINANGTVDPELFDGVRLQDDIDAMFA